MIRLVFALPLCLGFVLLVAGCGGPSGQDHAERAVAVDQLGPVEQLRRAITARDWTHADAFTQDALISRPGDTELMVQVAHVHAMNGRPRDAALLMSDAVSMSGFKPVERVDFAVQALIDVGELYAAIDLLERSLEVHPKNGPQRRRLVGFLGEAHRLEKIPPHLKELIRQRQFDFPLLVTTTETSFRRFSKNSVDELLKRNPADRRILLGEAFEMLATNDFSAAAKILQEILEHHPDFAIAHAMYGQALVGQHRYDELEAWIGKTPSGTAAFSEYWVTIGDWASEQQQHAAATRAYWNATEADPNSSTAWSRLARAVRSAQRLEELPDDRVSDDQLRGIDQRLANLLELRRVFYIFSAGNREGQSDAVSVAQVLFDLGRIWEAEAWSAAATKLTEKPTEQLEPLRSRILAVLMRDASWQSELDRPALTMNLTDLPAFPDGHSKSATKRRSPMAYRSSSDHLRMVDESESWGLGSVGDGNGPDDPQTALIIHTTGVGGGAIDYDLDGNADVLVMGAGGTMLEKDSIPNELLRNVGGRFVAAGQVSGIDDRGFGQGLAVGDFNEDGFPDLFFANLGVNRLLANNGDGTFSDRTEWLGQQHSDWTTSAAFADINADGLSDLLTVNYCEVSDRLDQPCINSDTGLRTPCHPLRFNAEGDRFYTGSADGHFRDVTSKWIDDVAPGRGLGIMAGAFDGKQLAVFVANDIAANHFYTHPGDGPLVESAMARGLAVDARTMTQASMGVATGDYDGDGDIDFFVTGFAGEYNIYYEQVAPGFWQDEAGRMELVEPFLSYIGFGTQTIDLNNDGVDEMMITNGHIGDFSQPDSEPYRQPFQVIERSPDGGFDFVNSEDWGDYFSNPHVGRTIWTMDVNRDGKLDAMVTHLHEPVALLVNRTEAAGHRIGFRLVGTDCSRDAIGAVIRLNADRPHSLWMQSGDGYFCSNEKVLRAGLGSQTRVENVTVAWPDGSVSNLGSLAADRDYLIVQGQDEAFVVTP